MNFTWNGERFGSKALGARVAGLGIAATLAVTVGTAPVVALAEDAAVTGNEVVAAVAEVSATAEDVASQEQAPQATAVTEQADAPAVVPSAETPDPDVTPATTTGTEAGADAPSTQTEDAPAAGGNTAAKTAKAAADPSTTESEEGGNAGAQTAKEAAAATATKNEEAEETPQATATAVTAEAEASAGIADKMNVYRLFNPANGEHLYTRNIDEATKIASEQGWQWEGIGFTASSSSGQAVWRLYERATGLHLWTTDANERKVLLGKGKAWDDEGLAWYGAGPYHLMRLYNPKSGQHLYTRDANEVTVLTSKYGWTAEDGAGTWNTGSASDYVPIQAHWMVSSSWGTLERYWIQGDGSIAKNRFVEASEGAGYRAYATKSGAVLRGKQMVNSVMALANNDGKLLADVTLGNHEGWWVTDTVDGSLQRYWLTTDLATGVMGARIGRFSDRGAEYFGREDEGYVVRGVYFSYPLKTVFHASDDGVLYDSNTQVDQYVRWMIAMAEDDSRGYSQIWRWGERGDYDCSSLTISALRHAGYNTGAATYTGNMTEELTQHGWYSVGVNPANLQYGDVLLNDRHHAAVYICNGYLVQASSDENESWEGYIAGDQTGKEIYIKRYYNYPWTRYLRHV